MVDLKNHFCLQHAETLREINGPLKLIGIDNFSYASIDLKTQKRYVLTEYPAFTQFYYQKKIYHSALSRCVQTPYFWEMYLWNDFPHAQFVQTIREFGIYSGTTMIKSSKEKHEYYMFSTNTVSDNNFFMHRKEYLKEYIQYFNYTENSLIQDSKKHMFCTEPYLASQCLDIDKTVLENFKKAIQINK
jgi:hypothetical protein